MEEQGIFEALDSIDHVVAKLAMLRGLISFVPLGQELAFWGAGIDGLAWFLDGLGDDLEQAVEIVRKGEDK